MLSFMLAMYIWIIFVSEDTVKPLNQTAPWTDRKVYWVSDYQGSGVGTEKRANWWESK